MVQSPIGQGKLERSKILISVMMLLFLLTMAGTVILPVHSISEAHSGVDSPGTFPVVFTENGLQPGSRWSVTVLGITFSSNSSTITLQLPIGDYNFTATGAVSLTASGSFSVTGDENNSFAVVLTIQMMQTPPNSVVYDPKNSLMYSADLKSGSVSVLNTTTVIANIKIGSPQTVQNFSFSPAPIRVICDPTTGYIYVTGFNQSAVYVINGTSVIATIPVGPHSINTIKSLLQASTYGGAYDPANGIVYLAHQQFSDNLTLIKGTKAIGTVTLPGSPSEIAYDPSNEMLYVTSFANGSIYLVNGTGFVGSINVSSSPYSNLIGIDYNPVNHLIYAADNGDSKIDIINGTRLFASISVPKDPWSVASNPSDGYEYSVSSGPNSTVSVINGTQVIKSMSFEQNGYYLDYIAYNPLNDFMYATGFPGELVEITSHALNINVSFANSGDSSKTSTTNNATSNGNGSGSSLVSNTSSSTINGKSASSQNSSSGSAGGIIVTEAGVISAVIIGAVVSVALLSRPRRA